MWRYLVRRMKAFLKEKKQSRGRRWTGEVAEREDSACTKPEVSNSSLLVLFNSEQGRESEIKSAI